ncbi:MAG: outer membrane protein assembly factor BamA [Thermodesulfovibrionia bacterium]|nr:outer membrane protein assembly factor BamA [Thermodesulfovibrionia bacterium]
MINKTGLQNCPAKSINSLIHLTVFLVISAFIFTAILAGSAAAAPLIKSIDITGNKKIEEATVRSKMKSIVGEPFSESTVQDDIKSIYSIGYFDDISVEIEQFEGGIKLIFTLQEKPTIVSIDFQGNEEFEAEKLKEKVTIASGAIANPQLIADNVEKIVSFYQSEGYWHARVIPVIREISEDAVALTFQVDEGKKVVIKDITFEGNSALSDKKIEKVMTTKEWWLFSFITSSGKYSKDALSADIERIRDLYNSKGYIYIVISEPEITLNPEKTKLFIKINISEGDQYKVGDVKFAGNTVFENSRLSAGLKTISGEIFDRSALRGDIDNIVELYMEKGYARADINPLIDVDKGKKTADITMAITEGAIFSIGRIEISGNKKTRDKVIRREMRLDEGETFNSKLLKRSYERITNLNFFESVNITPLPSVEESLIDLHVNVEEKLTGMLSVGGGYSSVDKFMVMGELTQANLFGKGLYLKFKAELSATRTNYNISLRDPWFMDQPISASMSLYNESFEYPDYDKKTTGGSIGFGKELSEYVAGNIVYNIESVEITNVVSRTSSLISDQIGTSITSSISPSIWRDTRDNYIDTTTGTRTALYTTVAGLGGDNYFVKGVIDSGRYFPLFWNTVFSLRGRLGYASGFNGKELPLYERFYVGGINTVRGLSFGEAGPRNPNGERIGGNKEVIFNAEFIFPLAKEAKLNGVAFFDAGRAFENNEKIYINDLRPTTGLGVRWTSPFGPIRLEWGYNIDPKPDESSSKIEFTMGGVY